MEVPLFTYRHADTPVRSLACLGTIKENQSNFELEKKISQNKFNDQFFNLLSKNTLWVGLEDGQILIYSLITHHLIQRLNTLIFLPETLSKSKQSKNAQLAILQIEDIGMNRVLIYSRLLGVLVVDRLSLNLLDRHYLGALTFCSILSWWPHENSFEDSFEDNEVEEFNVPSLSIECPLLCPTETFNKWSILSLKPETTTKLLMAKTLKLQKDIAVISNLAFIYKGQRYVVLAYEDSTIQIMKFIEQDENSLNLNEIEDSDINDNDFLVLNQVVTLTLERGVALDLAFDDSTPSLLVITSHAILHCFKMELLLCESSENQKEKDSKNLNLYFTLLKKIKLRWLPSKILKEDDKIIILYINGMVEFLDLQFHLIKELNSMKKLSCGRIYSKLKYGFKTYDQVLLVGGKNGIQAFGF